MAKKFDYQSEVLDLTSKDFHLDKLSIGDRQAFTHHLRAAARHLQALDKFKKTLFYGRDLGLPNRTVNPTEVLPQVNAVSPMILHAILGVATEAGELLESLEGPLYGGTSFDMVNFREELGDVRFYQVLGAAAADRTPEQIDRGNIDKLHTRYKAKTFTADEAVNRDLPAEQEVLEST
jgi:hypothetical protein